MATNGKTWREIRLRRLRRLQETKKPQEINKKYFGIIADMSMALMNDGVGLYDFEKERPEQGERKPYSTDGRKCGQCAKFGTAMCKCKLAKETSPACSVMTIR